MADNVNYSLKGIGDGVEIGLDGPRLFVESGNLVVRTNNGLSLVKIVGAQGSGPDDFVTFSQLGQKQDTLVSGTNIKTINGESVLGSGNLVLGGSGTVTSVSVSSANGFAGTVSNPTTTPAITISTTVTGLLVGNGTSIAAAVSGTDVKTVNSVSILGSGNISVGTVTNTSVTSANGFAGTVATSTTTPAITISTTVNGILFGNGTSVAAATFANLPINLYKENASSPTTPSATGTNAVAVGSGSTASAILSYANGDGSDAKIWGQKAFANGRFATNGDAQSGLYVLRATTTNATATDLFLDGAAATQRLVTPINSVWTFRISVVARNTTTAQGAGYVFQGVVRKDGTNATIVFVGTPSKTVLGENNTAWDANVTANTTNGDLRVSVTGAAGQTIRWVATVETAEVTN